MIRYRLLLAVAFVLVTEVPGAPIPNSPATITNLTATWIQQASLHQTAVLEGFPVPDIYFHDKYPLFLGTDKTMFEGVYIERKTQQMYFNRLTSLADKGMFAEFMKVKNEYVAVMRVLEVKYGFVSWKDANQKLQVDFLPGPGSQQVQKNFFSMIKLLPVAFSRVSGLSDFLGIHQKYLCGRDRIYSTKRGCLPFGASPF